MQQPYLKGSDVKHRPTLPDGVGLMKKEEPALSEVSPLSPVIDNPIDKCLCLTCLLLLLLLLGAVHKWRHHRRGRGGVSQKITSDDEGKGGVTIPPKNDDVIYEQPLGGKIVQVSQRRIQT